MHTPCESDRSTARARRYVNDLLSGHLPKDRVFHSLRHKFDTYPEYEAHLRQE